MKGLLFLIIGPSGVGKNTLILNLLESRQDLRFVPSYSSRPVRPNESDGQPYYFVSHAQFEAMIQHNELLEWKHVYGEYYGVGRSKVAEPLAAGQHLITDIEVLGAMDVIDVFPLNCVSVYVDVPDQQELAHRILARATLAESELQRRLKRASIESQYKGHFDYSLCNVDVGASVYCLNQIISTEIALHEYSTPCVPKRPLHYVLNLFIENEHHELLAFHTKINRSEYNATCRLCTTHLLAHEPPHNAAVRFFALMRLSDDADRLIEGMRYLGSKTLELASHTHYVMVYQLRLESADIVLNNCDEYLFKWYARRTLGECLSRADAEVLELLV